ncbi:MAG: AI-2E family transporter [Candidatus Promineifilaceae bacterium]|jgi:predicted PurR-regulated permease PerM
MSKSSSWSTTTRYLVLILMLGLLLWFLFVARELISPLIISMLIAFILNPLIDEISKKGQLGRNWVVLFVYLLFVALFVLIGVLVVPELPPLAARFAEQLDNIILVVEEVASRPVIILGSQIPLESLLANWPQLTQIITQPGLVINMFAATSQNLAWILLVLVTTYYLLLDGQRLRDWLFSLVPDSQKSDVVRLYIEVRTVWNQYLQGQLRLMFIVGLATGIAAMAIGLPGALAFGVLAGLFDIILSVGPLIVMIIGAIVAYVAGSNYLDLPNFWFAVLVVVLFGGINVVENIWLRPRIMGNSLRLHPAIVFVAIVGSLALAGILVALIIVPVIGSALVIGRYLYCKILDIDPWPDDKREQTGQVDPAAKKQIKA